MTWTQLSLSSATVYNGVYSGGKIGSPTAGSGYAAFGFPSLVLDAATTYEFELTFDVVVGTNVMDAYSISNYSHDHWVSDTKPWLDQYKYANGSTAMRVTMGPGKANWDYAVSLWGEIRPIFEFSWWAKLTGVRYQEVDATPANTIAIYTPVGGSLAEAGGPSAADATPISTLQISKPTGPSAGQYWWKFTAAETSKVNFDADLSYRFASGYNYSPSVEFYDSSMVFLGYASNTSYDVVAGQTYYIKLVSPEDGVIMYLRTSGYGRSTDWIDPGLQTIVLDGGGGYHPPDYGVYRYLGNGYWGSSSVSGITQTLGGQGGYELWQSFGGPYAADDGAGVACSWHWSRKGVQGSQWWSATMSGSSWGGYGTCRALSSDFGQNISSGGGYIGISYHADTGGFLVPQFTGFNTYSIAAYASVHGIEQAYGVAPDPNPDRPADFYNASLEWESEDYARLVDLEMAPDESTDQTGPGQTRWMLHVTPDNSHGLENPVGQWGPSRNDPDYGYTIWRGNGDGPEGAEGRAQKVFTTYSGGAYPFESIGGTLVEAARAMEENGSMWSSYSLPTTRAALCFIGYHPAITSDTVPQSLIGPFNPAPQSHSSGRGSQAVSLRATLQPVRHRWVEVPLAPFADVEYELLDPNLSADLDRVLTHFDRGES